MAQWITGIVAGNRRWREGLHSLQVDADLAPFTAGQFARLGLVIGDEAVGRPYSLVNPPARRPLEFFFNVVPTGPLSPRLAALKPGDEVLLAPRANGFLVIREVPQGRHLWLISTGTGIGPFLSILRTDEPWQRFEHVVLVHAVRHAADLCHRSIIEGIVAARPGRMSFVPFVSREATDFALSGRVPQAIADGRLEARAGLALQPADSQVVLCGNPQMVDEVTATLEGRGMRKHRRRDPGHISVETYW